MVLGPPCARLPWALQMLRVPKYEALRRKSVDLEHWWLALTEGAFLRRNLAMPETSLQQKTFYAESVEGKGRHPMWKNWTP